MGIEIVNLQRIMKFQIGDSVLILHSNEEGTIINFINKKMALVEVDGIQFPVYIDQIDFPYFKDFTNKKKVEKPQKTYVEDIKREKTKAAEKEENGVWLNFLPVSDLDEFGDEVVHFLKLYLVNNTSKPYNFNYKLNFFGSKPEFELKNTVQPFENFYIHDVDFDDMSDSPSFHFEFSLLIPDKQKATHYEASVKLKPKQLFAKIEELRAKNLASFSQILFEIFPNRPVEVKDDFSIESLSKKGFKVYSAKEAHKHLEPAQSVVDLHIEKLTEDWRRMSNGEMLNLQLKTFEKYYELAVAHRQPNLTMIHGLGTGRLRDEIHELLKLKSEVSYFVNQYHPAYGYGATEIFFKY